MKTTTLFFNRTDKPFFAPAFFWVSAFASLFISGCTGVLVECRGEDGKMQILDAYYCAPVNKQWVATGGSKADASVILQFDYRWYEKYRIDSGYSDAVKSCRLWGYSHATAFSPVETCNRYNKSGSCVSYLVTKQFQCIE